MTAQILVVEDNEDIQYNLKLLLELNEYEVITASNGKHAVEILETAEIHPDLIVSDIMMPEMDGYDLFVYVSSSPRLNQVPFIFLSAKSRPEDIRFGKMLGVDDYVTKPFQKEDLLASIKGKLERSKKNRGVNEKFQDLLSSMDITMKPSLKEEERSEIVVLHVAWDDRIGPEVKKIYTLKEKQRYSIETIGYQLFNAASFIYGDQNMKNARGVLLDLDNINRQAYAYFDAIPDPEQRSGEQQYMIAVIAPKISYFESLKIREEIEKYIEIVKEKRELDLKALFDKVANVLLISIFND